MFPASRWPTRRRFALAAASGMVWGVLMVGLIGMNAPPLVFLAANALLLGPTLGALARSYRELLGLALAAVSTSILIVLLLALYFSQRRIGDLDYATLAATLGLNWTPALAVAPLVQWAARRGPPPQDPAAP